MDKRALKILLNTYWSASGWTRIELSAEDFEFAKSRRMMFDPQVTTHDETIFRLREVAACTSSQTVANAFLCSLSTRRLDWRSALGSYSIAQGMPDHKQTPGEHQCNICGLYAGKSEHDLNVLNFERFKWGGVRHANPVYALLDLQLLADDPAPSPTIEDHRILGEIVAAAAAVPPAVTSAALQSHLAGIFKSNKSERDQLIAILGIAGVLATAEHPGFADRFVPYACRSIPNRHFVDMAYPACWWTGRDGVNARQIQRLFGVDV